MDNSCKLFVENITPEQLQELDNSISNEGEFRMKNKDEHIKEIYEKDKNVLEQNHITYEHIGHLMEIFNDITNLNQIFDNGKLMEFYINYVFNNTLIPEILKKYNIYAYLAGLQSVFEYENYYVVPVRYLGACVCPFQKLTSNKNYNGCEYGNSDIVVINKLTKKPMIKILEQNIFGADISDTSIYRSKILLTLFALLNGEDKEEIKFNIIDTDSLSYKWKVNYPNGFDVVIGNPPYVEVKNYNVEYPFMHKYINM